MTEIYPRQGIIVPSRRGRKEFEGMASDSERRTLTSYGNVIFLAYRPISSSSQVHDIGGVDEPPTTEACDML